MATPAPRPLGREVFVHIVVDNAGAITVDPDTFWVSKEKNEEVVWHCTSTDPRDPRPHFKVDFDKNGTPFHDSDFGKDSPCSGLVRRDVNHGPKIYKYTVRVGDKSLDPGGGVHP